MDRNVPLVIEVRCNENRLRAGNEALPYSTDEIIDVAQQVASAGASMFHFHVRHPESGAPLHAAELYGEVIGGVRSTTDLVVHPTTGFTDESDPEQRLRPILQLEQDAHRRPDMVAIAFGVTNVDLWDDSRSAFLPGDLVYSNTRSTLTHALSQLAAVEMPTISVCWELSHVRTALKYRSVGQHPGHRLWQFAFTDNALLAGAAPTVLALQAMLEHLPPEEPWMVWCQGGDVLPIAAHAIAMGGHVGIGLGDYDYPHLGRPTNADLVSHVAALSRAMGRSIATPEQARRILCLDRND